MDLITRAEAVAFIEETLGLDDAKRRLENDRLLFLNDVIWEYQCKVPFHNLDLLALPVSERRLPTTIELKERGLSGRGGLCYQTNGFLYLVLQVLGYDVTLAKAAVFTPGDHVLILAHSVVTSDDTYLVDTGCGHPTLQAIPLDFKDESPVYTFSVCAFKIVRKGDGEFSRIHMSKTTPHVRQFYHFDTEPCTFQDFDSSVSVPYTDPRSIFLTSLRVECFPMGKLLAIKDGDILEDQDGKVSSSDKINDSEAMNNAIHRLFPKLSSPKETLILAIEMWESFTRQEENEWLSSILLI